MRRGLWLLSLATFVILELMLIAAVLYWPQFEDNVPALRLVAPFLREQVDYIADRGVIPYVTGQHFFKGCNTLGTLAAVLFAAGAVAGEAHRGTLEIWLARPYSRARLLTVRFLAGALAFTLPVFLTTATIPLMEEWADEPFDLVPLLLCAAHQSCLLLAIYALTFFLSTIGSQPLKIALTVLFLSTFSFAIYFIKKVTHYSLFRLADMEDFVRIHDDMALNWSVCGPLLGVTVFFWLASIVAFARRTP